MSRRHFTIRVIQLFNPVIAMHTKSHENGGSERTSEVHFENADDKNLKKRKRARIRQSYILSLQYHVLYSAFNYSFVCVLSRNTIVPLR